MSENRGATKRDLKATLKFARMLVRQQWSLKLWGHRGGRNRQNGGG